MILWASASLKYKSEYFDMKICTQLRRRSASSSSASCANSSTDADAQGAEKTWSRPRRFRAHVQSPRPHAARRYTTAAPREPRYSNPRRGNWSRLAPLRMTRADEGGCRAPGPHAISTRTAHTTTTSSIDRVPKTAATGARQYPPLRDCHRMGRLPVYQSTSTSSLGGDAASGVTGMSVREGVP